MPNRTKLWVETWLARPCVLLSLILFCVAAPAFCTAGPSGYNRTIWQNQNGLPDQTVQAFAQTPDGYLWIGTTGGLLRFDGIRFNPIEAHGGRLFEDNGVFALLVTKDGTLWVGTEGGGLASYKDGTFHTYGPKEGFSEGFVRVIFEDSRGRLWVGADNGLYQVGRGRLIRIDGRDGFPEVAVHAIFEDHAGRVWVGGTRVLCLDGEKVHEYRLPGGSLQTSVKSILELQDHTIWVGSVAGLHQLRPGATAFEKIPEVQGTVRVLRQTSDGTIWIGTIGQGLRAIKNGKTLAFTAPEWLPSNTVLNIFEDREKNLWAGTQAGMLRLTASPISIIPLPGARDSDFGTLYEDRDDTLWVVATDIFRVRNGVAAPYRFPQLGNIHARNVFRDRDGALWVGTDGDGLFRIRGSSVLHLTTKEGLIGDFIRAIFQSRDGSFWFLTDGGVSHWNRKKFENYNMSNGLSFFSTRSVAEDRSGDVWIGAERGLSHWHAGKLVSDAATNALRNERVWSILLDSEGSLWFGTRTGGLYRWSDGRLAHITTNQGLASNSIYQVIEDAKGAFWISGPNGISHIQHAELVHAAEDRAYRPSLDIFSVSDYMQNAQIYGGRQPSGCLGQHGDVWFPSNRGAIHVVTGEAQTNAPISSLAIQQVSIDGRDVPVAGAVTIDPGNHRLEISYAPILLRSQDSVRFRYRLDGFDAEWNDASSKRVASYTNLPPGQYQFQVEAFELNNPSVVVRTFLSVAQRPHFYRTPWFVVLCVLIAGGIAVVVYRLRVWQVKGRFQAVLTERGRLAREMHDTVIQGCVGVSSVLEALSSLPNDNGTARDLMEHARTQIRTTIDSSREVIWNLRHEKASEVSLQEAIAGIAQQISQESGVAVTCEVTGRPFVLSEVAVHELVMTVREAIYNAVLHARPRKVETQVCFTRNELTIDVRDDGAGFDMETAHQRDSRHYGLLGMEERVQAVGGTLNLESSSGRGTHLQVRVPRKAGVARSAMVDA